MSPDPVTEALADISARLDRILASRKDVCEKVNQLAITYPDCLELALTEAILWFYAKSPDEALEKIAFIAMRWGRMYEIGRWELVDFISLRRAGKFSGDIESWQYTRAVFGVNYVKHRKGRADLLSWVKYEQSKKIKKRNYNDLSLLRNLLISLRDDAGFSAELSAIMLQIKEIDASLIRILRDELHPATPRARGDVRRIVICAGLLRHSRRGMHARLVFEYARNLASSEPDIEVMIVVSNEIPFDLPPFALSTERITEGFRDSLLAAYKRIVEPQLRGRVKFENMRLENRGWQDLMAPIRRILSFDPDVVMHYGSKFANESFLVRRSLYHIYPTVYFFSQMNNGVDRYNDIYLARNGQPLRGPHDPTRIRIAPPPLRSHVINQKFDGKPTSYALLDVKSTPEELTLVSVLGGERMEALLSRYSQSTRRQMMDLLDLADNVRWIWVGPNSRSGILAVDQAFSRYEKAGKLSIRTFENDLMALYKHCNLFLHLPGFTGGAGGLLMALSAGLPVLCFKDTDASAHVPATNRFDPSDLAGFFNRAAELITRPELRRTSSAECLASSESQDISSLTSATMSGLREAAEIFNSRIMNTPAESKDD